jgi:uncharacterized protein
MAEIHVRCPTCQRVLDWHTAPFRPFCSERCRLIDLGAWFTEQRSIPGENSAGDAPSESRNPESRGDLDE